MNIRKKQYVKLYKKYRYASEANRIFCRLIDITGCRMSVGDLKGILRLLEN